MKLLLSFLLCFVFLEAQTFAQTVDQSNIASNGGPNYGGSASVVGTYAGVLIPTSVMTSSTTTKIATTSNALGIFSIGVPATGVATGGFLIFASGQGFTGDIVGIANPNTLTLQAVLAASFTPTTTTNASSSNSNVIIITGGNTTTSTATATGDMTATISQGTSGDVANPLTGTASLTVLGIPSPSGVGTVNTSYNLVVNGFQQSTTVSAGTVPTLP